jgi:outer membrane protein
MRKLILLLFFVPCLLSAQNKFGYFSYSKVLESLPQYAQANEELELLKQRCNDELERNEQELTRLYVAYLDGQRDFPEPILRRRQNELQQLVDNSVILRSQLKSWLLQARDSLLAPCHEAIELSLARVCTAHSLSYAIDTDVDAYKYINPLFGVDITEMLITDVLSYDAAVSGDDIQETSSQASDVYGLPPTTEDSGE